MIAPVPRPGGQTVQKFLHDVYVPSRLNLSLDGIYQIEIVVRQFNRFAGNPRIDELTDEMVCGFLRHCRDRGLKPSTVNGKRSKIIALWNCAWRKRLHDEQPRDIPCLREPRTVPSAWTAEEIQRLITHAATMQGHVGDLPAAWYWPTLVLAAWETGLRIGALRDTQPADVMLDVPAIMVRPAAQKTGVGQYCPITPSLAAAIKRYHHPWRHTLWGWPRSRQLFYTIFRRIVEGAGLSASYGGHDLFYRIRRSHLSYVARESLEAARRQAGHTNAAITLRHYIDPTIAGAESVVNMLPKITLPRPKL